MESGNIRGSLSNVPMNCVNCGLPFDLVNNTPYKLNCGHTGKSIICLNNYCT
jgi:hypothetical protein